MPTALAILLIALAAIVGFGIGLRSGATLTRKSDASRVKGHALDRAATLIRLARLAEKRGADAEAAQYLNEAVALCPEINIAGLSVDVLVEAESLSTDPSRAGRVYR